MNFNPPPPSQTNVAPVTVSVLMPTYNHELYIAQAIESFLAQKLYNYSAELLIGNDCSSDKTEEIALHYAKENPKTIHYFSHKENKGLMHNYKFLLEQAKGAFIAILESDDYWVDEEKLFKQITFFLNHSDFGLIATAANDVDENNTLLKSRCDTRYDNKTDWYDLLLEKNTIRAVTVCFRKKTFETYCNINDYIERGFLTFDYPTWLAIARHSKCIYLPEITAHYRILQTSISNANDYKRQLTFEKTLSDILYYTIEKFGAGRFKADEITDMCTRRYIDKAMLFNVLSDYIKYAHTIKIHSIKSFFLKFFPLTYLLIKKLCKKI